MSWYGFCSQVYTSRRLAKKIWEDIGFMWLSAGQRLCFKTLSHFRSKRMKGMVDLVFNEVLYYLVKHEYIDLNNLFVNGSKWEANANQYKIIWGKNTKRYKQRVLERITLLLEEAEALQAKEDELYGCKDLKEHKQGEEIAIVLTSTQLAEQIKYVNGLVEAQNDKTKKRGLKKISRHLKKEAGNLRKYEEQEKKLGKRNSFSRTDEDATAMRMKNDELRPGYNTEISNLDFLHNLG